MSDDRTIDRLRAQAAGCFARHDLDGGIRLLEQALAIDAELADIHAWLAIALVDRRLIAAARAEVEIAFALDPALAICQRAMAHVLLAEGKRHAAKPHYESAVELEPDDTDHLLALARIKRMLGEDARPELERALELEPDEPEVLAACSDAAFHAGKFDEAERFAREALESDPEHADALVAMGWVLLERGQLDDARTHAIMALRANPSDPDGLRLLAAYKARTNWFLGMWFRWNVRMSTRSEGSMVAVLLGIFIAYRLIMLVLADLELGHIAEIVGYLWLAFVAYTWVGPVLFQRMLQKELAQLRIDPRY